MKRIRKSALLLACVVCLLFAGCSTFKSVQGGTKRLVGRFGSTTHQYQKVVALTPFSASPKWAPLLTTGLFITPLSETMRDECSDMHLLMPGQEPLSLRLAEAVNTSEGIADNFTLALTGQTLGINVIIFSRLADILLADRKEGVLWFKDEHPKAKVQIDVMAFHCGTGAKVMDESIFFPLEVNESQGKQVASGQWPEGISIEDVMAEIATMSGEMICEALQDEPWEGYISAVSGDKVSLPFGQMSQLETGHELDVYAVEKVMEGANQFRYFVPGLSTGKIKITSVSGNTSEGTIVEGDAIRPGSIVRALRKE